MFIGALFIGLLVLSLGLSAGCQPAGEDGDDGPYGGGAVEPAATEPAMETDEKEMPPAEGEDVEVVMRNTAFEPEEITVAPGTTVTWTNEDSFAHTVTAGTRGDPTGMFDEDVSGGDTFSFTFEEPGTYDYFCRPHSGMDGVVIVEE
ncbi:MAG: plastocyanin/azurin family copper-binding protein [Anaerolineae bacterium]